LGQKLNKQNDYLNGYQNLARAIEISPNEPVIINELSIATASTTLLSFSQKDENTSALTEAANYYSNLALEKSPKNLNLYKSRVKVLYTLAQIDEKYLDKAIETIKKAITLAPTDPKLVYNLGLLYGRKGMAEEALTEITKAIEMKPNYEEARNALAIFYEDLGMKKEALEQLEIIYKNKKDDHSVLERIETLKKEIK
jgi:Flp pilus assembly protein TadD